MSSYDLKQLGYDQPPRAVQDLKEFGVKVKTDNGKHPISGSRMAIWTLSDDQTSSMAYGGRIAFTKSLRESLLKRDQNRCVICCTEYSSRYLQIDHKIPFIVGGEPSTLNLDEFQMLCGSHQRMKSWECEHCSNRIAKLEIICKECYWASPVNYTHVATKHHKVISIKLENEEELAKLNSMKMKAEKNGETIEQYIKNQLF